MKILLINGPNLNLLGLREPEVYGHETLPDLVAALREQAAGQGVELQDFQSNVEGEIINTLHAAREEIDGILINPGAFTHYSIAIRDAISSIDVPVIELHISNVQAREAFRHHSVLSAVCLGVIAGFGRDSYFLALDGMLRHLRGAVGSD